MVEGGTSHHQQVLAITPLRSGRRVDNHVQEKEDEQPAIPQNLQKEKGKQERIEASSSSAPTPEMPYLLICAFIVLSKKLLFQMI